MKFLTAANPIKRLCADANLYMYVLLSAKTAFSSMIRHTYPGYVAVHTIRYDTERFTSQVSGLQSFTVITISLQETEKNNAVNI